MRIAGFKSVVNQFTAKSFVTYKKRERHVGVLFLYTISRKSNLKE